MILKNPYGDKGLIKMNKNDLSKFFKNILLVEDNESETVFIIKTKSIEIEIVYGENGRYIIGTNRGYYIVSLCDDGYIDFGGFSIIADTLKEINELE